MLLSILGFGEQPQEQEPPMNVMNNPSFGAQPFDAARMAYHSEVQRLEKERLEIRAMLEGKEIKEKSDGRLELVTSYEDDGTVTPPFCTSKGRRAIMDFVNERLNPNVALSNYTKPRIYQLLIEDHKYIHALVHNNIRRWNIDVLVWESVHFSIMGMCEATYKRALDGGERRWVTEIFNTVQTISGSTETQKAPNGIKGWFSGGK